jgi:hypothetical protein
MGSRRTRQAPLSAPGAPRTAWHVLLARLLAERAPRSFEVRSEVPLGKHPPRVDLLLVRRRQGAGADRGARVLRHLWERIERVAVLEYKSPAEPVRPGALMKLLGYALLHGAEHPASLGPSRRGLLVGLMVASLTPTLVAELARLGLTLPADEGGYYEVQGLPWPLLLMVLDEVSEAERDELLGAFGHHRIESLEARVWWQQQTGETMAKLKEMPGYLELEQKFINGLSLEQRLAGLAPEQILSTFAPEQRLAGLAPEQRLAGLAPEQRLAGLAPEQRLAGLAPGQRLAGLSAEEAVLALPDELLRGLSSEYVARLPRPVRDAVARRLGAPGKPPGEPTPPARKPRRP